MALIVAGLPIVAGIAGAQEGPAPEGPLAGAPPNLVAVLAAHSRDFDTVVAQSLAEGGEPREVARIAHLPDHAVRGAVSPDGRLLALNVPNGGSPSRPRGSLQILDLATGAETALGEGLDALGTPLWRPDGLAVIARRNAAFEGAAAVELVEFPVTGAPGGLRARFTDVLGAYPVAFDPEGRLLVVLIDARGSTLVREDGVEWELSAGVTRDWELSPTGSTLAFIEDSTVEGGRRFQARLKALDGSVTAAAEVSLSGQQLGVAWRAGSPAPTFGFEPGAAGASAQASSRRDGFDVPLAFSPDGAVLAVEAWTGQSFADHDEVRLAFVTASGRRVIAGPVRFLGWSAR